MSTATLARPATRPAPPSRDGDRFLRSYVVTMLTLTAGLVVVEAGLRVLAGQGWPVALAAVIGFSAVVAGVLRRRSCWVVVGLPAVVLALPAGAGWLTPEGLMLWAPLTTVLAAGLALAARPLPPS